MSTTAHKFGFDTDLTQRQTPTVSLTHNELEAKLKEAVREGFVKGQNDVAAQHQAQMAAHLAQIEERFVEQLKILGDGLQQVRTEVEAHGALVTKAALEKLMPQLLARNPIDDIDAMIAQCFAGAHGAPHIVIRCHRDFVQTITPIGQSAGNKTGFEGTIITLGDDEMAPGDCRLEWAQGGFSRDTRDIQRQIISAIDAFVSAKGIDHKALDASHEQQNARRNEQITPETETES